MRWGAVLGLVLAWGWPQVSWAESLEERLVAARLEAESLAQELRAQTEASRASLASLRREKAELERQLRLERIRQRTLRQIAQKRVSDRTAQQKEADQWEAPVMAAIAEAQSYVRASLPFALEDRLGTLERFHHQLESGQSDPGQVLMGLTNFLDDERKLSREAGLSRQSVTIEGQVRRLSVLRIGMTLLYAKTNQDEVYAAVPDSSGQWTFEKMEGEAQSLALRLFSQSENNRLFGLQRLVLPRAAVETR